jgi:dUTP pyrophosphatase
MSLCKGLMLANGVGVIDPFYCGDKDEFLALLLNITAEPVTVEVGEKLVQGMFIQPASIAWDEVGSFATKGHGGYSISEEVRQ